MEKSKKFIMYVDASGDDGVKFLQGSSSHYAVSCFLIHEEDRQHNLDILAKIKWLMGAKETDEVKYAKVRRHPKTNEIHNLLKQTKGFLYTTVVFKQETDSDILAALGGLSHAIAISCLDKHSKNFPDSIVSIHIDRMKKAEMNSVETLIRNHNEKYADLPQHTLYFNDSKEAGYELIQMADIFAGLTRRYFEESSTNVVIRRITKICPACMQVKYKKLCGKTKAAARNQMYINKIIHLYENSDTLINFIPATLWKKFYYLMCPK